VIIDASTTVTVDVGTAECNNIAINGTLDFNAGMLLEVFGDFTNNGTFTAGSGNKVLADQAAVPSAAVLLQHLIISSLIKDRIRVLLSSKWKRRYFNTGILTINNGLFKMTNREFSIRRSYRA